MSDRPPRQSGRRRDFASVSEIDSGENGFTRSDIRTLLRPLVRQMKSPREWILPVALSSASILLTSLVLAEFHSHLTAFHVWSDPEDLALAYLLPTIFIAVFFGSTIAATSSFASGLAAAYFIYPPKFSVLIDAPQQVAELDFIIALAITASKAVAVITDDKPLARRFRGEGPVASLRAARERPVTERPAT